MEIIHRHPYFEDYMAFLGLLLFFELFHIKLIIFICSVAVQGIFKVYRTICQWTKETPNGKAPG